MDNASNQKHQQLVLPCAGGSLEVSTAEAHTCQGREIIIRVYAIALNPFDKEQLETASAISRWPTVLGIEGAGVVESCGALVDGFNPGDEVLALFSIGEDNRSAAFQSHAVVDVSMVCHKPPDMSFADAASIPLAFVTALHTIRKAFHLPKRGREHPSKALRMMLLPLHVVSTSSEAILQLEPVRYNYFDMCVQRRELAPQFTVKTRNVCCKKQSAWLRLE